MSGIVLGSNTITINGKIMESGKYYTFIQEPTSSPSVSKVFIDSEYKYMSFANTGVAYSSYRFRMIDTRIANGDLQFTEIDFFNTSGANIVPNTLSASYTHSSGYDPSKTIDNKLNTKWYSPNSDNTWIIYNFTTPFVLNYYEWTTADDSDGRDPIHWVMEVMVGGNWVILDEINYTSNKSLITTNRQTTAGTFYINKITQYTISFLENTECEILLLGNINYKTNSQIFNGNINISVGNNSTFGTITTTGGISYGSGFVSNITGGNITYNSPIVILRYKYTSDVKQWTYSSSNPNVYHLGNVGIGTTNPTSSLHVLGSVQVNGAINATTLSANTKNFKIEHPLNINKWLYHGCVEGPRFDNIYRGKKIIINGKGEVDIDEECNTTGGMTKGTFVSLNTNCQVYLENKQTYDSVKGKITDGKLIINCENIKEEIEIDWLVIGERYDNTVITNKLTNYEGSLICEHDKDH